MQPEVLSIPLKALSGSSCGGKGRGRGGEGRGGEGDRRGGSVVESKKTKTGVVCICLHIPVMAETS